jgi:hypothetical protein
MDHGKRGKTNLYYWMIQQLQKEEEQVIALIIRPFGFSGGGSEAKP